MAHFGASSSILKYLYCASKCDIRQFSSLIKRSKSVETTRPGLFVHTTPVNSLFWERDRKGGYGSKDEMSRIAHIRNGFKMLGSEIKLWTKEMKEHLENDRPLLAFPGETDIVWLFNSQESVKKFITASDSDHNQGFSKCYFDLSSSGRGLFHGNLDTRVPKDGRVKKAGYCAIRSTRARKSFMRDSTFDWTMYNTLVIKLRGDGRSYMINLSTEGYWDITWNDIYHYVLYTRGGPYWQIAKIPFSKFIIGSKGRLQDKQSALALHKITHFGIACGDKINGPFQLEIEYIGLEFDPSHDEEFAYELYKQDRYIVGV